MSLAMQKTFFFQLNLKKRVESTQKWHLKKLFCSCPQSQRVFCGGVHREGVRSWLLTGKFQSKAAQRDPPAAKSRFEKGPMKRPAFCVAISPSHGLSHARESLWSSWRDVFLETRRAREQQDSALLTRTRTRNIFQNNGPLRER